MSTTAEVRNRHPLGANNGFKPAFYARMQKRKEARLAADAAAEEARKSAEAAAAEARRKAKAEEEWRRVRARLDEAERRKAKRRAAEEAVIRKAGEAAEELHYATLAGMPRAWEVLRAACAVRGVLPAYVCGPSRARSILPHRHAIIRMVADARPDLSLPQLGRLFGGRHHTTILHSLRKTGGGR